jgi:hypothetical protein
MPLSQALGSKDVDMRRKLDYTGVMLERMINGNN